MSFDSIDRSPVFPPMFVGFLVFFLRGGDVRIYRAGCVKREIYEENDTLIFREFRSEVYNEQWFWTILWWKLLKTRPIRRFAHPLIAPRRYRRSFWRFKVYNRVRIILTDASASRLVLPSYLVSCIFSLSRISYSFHILKTSLSRSIRGVSVIPFAWISYHLNRKFCLDNIEERRGVLRNQDIQQIFRAATSQKSVRPGKLKRFVFNVIVAQILAELSDVVNQNRALLRN